jgi:hypothetical protein
MQLHKIKTALTRFVSQDSKPSADSSQVKKSNKLYTKSKPLENARCVWDLESEG